MRDISGIVIHCSDTPACMDIGRDEIRDWHLNNGWKDIGYHFVIRRNGVVEAGRPVEESGSHVKGSNKSTIGICLVGGHKGQFNYTRIQMSSLNDLVFNLKSTYPQANLMGHRDFQGVDKACPCFSVKDWFS